MNIDLVRTKLKRCSDSVTKATEEAKDRHNESYQDFMIWLIGYLDGLESEERTIKWKLDLEKK